ncbi:MAG: hypothetical protein DRI79_13045 [Chloroflexi bacterium]|nr:MAG: hypothetical protein DRI79_13045 [Chloroflexota bacterium]
MEADGLVPPDRLSVEAVAAEGEGEEQEADDQIGGWRFGIGGWRLGIRGWRFGIGGWRFGILGLGHWACTVALEIVKASGKMG